MIERNSTKHDGQLIASFGRFLEGEFINIIMSQSDDPVILSKTNQTDPNAVMLQDFVVFGVGNCRTINHLDIAQEPRESALVSKNYCLVFSKVLE